MVRQRHERAGAAVGVSVMRARLVLTRLAQISAVTLLLWLASPPWTLDTLAQRVQLPAGAAISSLQSTLNGLVGALTEGAPGTDTASSGLNGRLQRIAQHLTSLLGRFPAAGTLADNTANPTTTGAAAYMMCFDGTTWDRCVIGGDSTAGSISSTSGPQAMLDVTTDLDAETARTDGQGVKALGDSLGRSLTLLGCNRENRIRGQATINDGSSTSVIAAQGSGVIAEIYAIEIANTSASDLSVDIRDGTGGSVLWTLMAPATTDTGGGNNRVFNVPLTFTANTAVAADPSGSATSIIVSMLGCSAK